MFYAKYLPLLCLCGYSQSDEGDISADLLSIWMYDDVNEVEAINALSTNLNELNINNTKPCVLLCHGWKSDSNTSWYEPMIQGYLAKGYIVFAADWSSYSKSAYFSEAAPDIKPVAKIFANFTVNLHIILNVSLDSFHCVGHSLGAHLCGDLGQQVNKTIEKKIGRITGLDPAGPDFNLASDCHRLSKNDGNFVDVIHTMSGTLGIIESVGHIDFWPNGGSVQLVSCAGTILNYEVACSHLISTTYFIESMNNSNFIATKCSTYAFYTLGLCRGNEEAIMGENVNSSQTGNFYLKTNLKPPYAQSKTVFT